jgi:serine protease inhibitor
LYSGTPGNVAIAPISVAMALQIVYNGAGGATQQGMAQTLQLGSLSTQDLNSDNAALQGSLLNPDPQVNLTIANSLWMHLDANSVPAAFTQLDQTYYGATVGDLAGAPANVNNWVSTETDGLITNILPNANYAAVVAVIANVIYFKGQWSTAPDMLSGWVGQLQTGLGNLSMPKFTATFAASLVQPLTTLGMQAAFCADAQASFPGLGLVCIQDVEHKTVVEVDESGTVAAGATTVTIGPTAVELPLFTLTLDQPFLYAIRDDKTGELLFIGTMTNPS